MELMLRNAKDALDFLHRGNGEAVLSRKIAHKTQIVRVTDNVAALKLHDTFIAWYGEGCTVIDNGGWNTRTTWGRINDFTAAQTYGESLMRFVKQPNGDGVLYEPGCRVDPDGTVTNPMLPSRQRRIVNEAEQLIDQARAYATTAVAAWDAYAEDPCGAVECNGDDYDHILDHMRVCEPVLPAPWRNQAGDMTRTHTPDAVLRTVRKDFTRWLLTNVVPHGVSLIDADFTFPTPNINTNRSYA